MVEKTVQIKNSMGIHARPAAKIVKLAAQYSSEIQITKDGLSINGKSILGVMALAAERGSEVTIRTSGNDESEAMENILKLFESIFDEEE